MNDASLLLAAAVSIGFIHTITGPDHYLPFIMMSRAGRWSMPKTMLITLLSGLGHVLSSVVLGLIGVAAGVLLHKLKYIESVRGNIAAWLLIGFGIAYTLWGLRRAWLGKTHQHAHLHERDRAHEHEHSHVGGHAHVHVEKGADTRKTMTAWALFAIFVFGPCEPLIPLLMYPAANHNTPLLALVTMVFGAVTVGTMLGIVAAGTMGLRQLRLGFAEKYSHALAGLIIALSGLAIQFLGL